MTDTNATSDSGGRRAALVNTMIGRIWGAREQRDVPYRRSLAEWPPLSYEHIAGLWSSDQLPYIAERSHNRLRDRLLSLLSRLDTCVDYFYVNVWVLQNLMLAQRTCASRRFTDEEIGPTVGALTQRFCAPGTSPAAIFFWPKRVPGRAGEEDAVYPTNLFKKFNATAQIVRSGFRVLAAVGLEGWANRRLHLVTPMRLNNIMRTLKIPADADDSALYLSMGLFLGEMRTDYPRAQARWRVDVADFAAQLVRCAYRPFSAQRGEATIDPRSYFWMRGFLREVVREAEAVGAAPQLSLVTTWMQTYDETRRVCAGGQGPYVTPLYINNVDMAVSANAVHALTMALTRGGATDWFTPEVERLYADTVRLLAWSITTGTVHERPDLALLYYPDVHTFYWFVSRTLAELRRSSVADPALRAVVQRAHERLEAALRSATKWLISTAVDDGGLACWDGILGHGQDRMYITAATVNALFEIWTDADAGGRLRFLRTTPPEVVRLLPRACEFLATHASSGRYPWDNAFFSGSVKSRWTYHARYPANHFIYADGTPIDLRTTRLRALMNTDWTLGVTGYIPEDEYQRMIEARQFGLECGTERQPFSEFHYWSAPVVAQSICALALSRSVAGGQSLVSQFCTPPMSASPAHAIMD